MPAAPRRLRAVAITVDGIVARCRTALAEHTPALAVRDVLDELVADPDAVERAVGRVSEGGITTLHNADIQAVILQGGGNSLVFVADLLPTRHHIPYPWIMAYDLYPLQTLETKKQWVSRIIKENWIVVFGHDPDISAGTLHERDGKIEVSPVDLNR